MRDLDFELRLDEVKAMNEAIIMCGDEELWLTWIALGVPDEPSEEDFEWFAEDINEYNDLVKLYKNLMAQY